MKLAKPRIDIGFATNNAPAALAFWQNEIGLPFDHTQPIRRGYKQHRHDLCGSILKINQVYEPLPDNPPSGYRELLIARDGIAAPQADDRSGRQPRRAGAEGHVRNRTHRHPSWRSRRRGASPLLQRGAWAAAGRSRPMAR